MASYEIEVKLSSATNLKNVNWRNGPNSPYAVVWVDPNQKRSTNVDKSGDTQANWDEKLVIPLPPSATIDDSTLFVDVFHASSESEGKPLIIGSAQLRLIEVRNDVGIGERASRTLKLKRPSGRPQGTVDVKVVIEDTGYRARSAYEAPAYCVPPPSPAYGGSSYNAAPPTTGYGAPIAAAYGAPAAATYGAPAATGYGAAPATGYGAAPATGYGAAPASGYGAAASYGQGSYGYGQGVQTVNVAAQAPVEEKKKSKFGGMGMGLAVGAVAGGLGALALGKGVDMIEDKIADRAAEKVEEDYSGYPGEDYSDYDF
ncbi:WW domain-containing protein C11B10.08-like [Gastrolobium bilobum]|uniref:WW domain-containing protein C11B10.08-like n=1 Tax=Gastrolobium bilobum TaxID=150636 RepID=UPI002AAFAD09|nr:WW domain-containing protein C11B10.08-like [Gastrolobium bilobum]